MSLFDRPDQRAFQAEVLSAPRYQYGRRTNDTIKDSPLGETPQSKYWSLSSEEQAKALEKELERIKRWAEGLNK